MPELGTSAQASTAGNIFALKPILAAADSFGEPFSLPVKNTRLFQPSKAGRMPDPVAGVLDDGSRVSNPNISWTETQKGTAR